MLFLRLHETGMKQIDIARMHGLSQARGWQIVQVARRRKEMRERSPGELWCLNAKWETAILPKWEFDRLKEFMRPMKLGYQPPPCPPYQGPPIVWGSVDS
jgi:hypothetical protein